MKRFLYISYVFPPAGGAGVQRGVKLVKYIGRYGWEPVVVTPTRPSVPVLDPSLVRELPPGLIVRRLPTLEPPPPGARPDGAGHGRASAMKTLAARLLFPDRHALWLPTACYGALAAVRRFQPRVILVSAPPFSSFLLGWWLARLTGLPLVLDFRDEWSGFYLRGFEAGRAGRLWAGLVSALEGAMVRAAARITSASPDYNRRFRELYGGPAGKYAWVPNGYDPDDFPAAGAEPQPLPGQPLRLVYTGTLMKVTSLRYLWSALELLSIEQRRRLQVDVAGRVAEGETADPGLPGLAVKVHGYLAHGQAAALMRAADALLLTLSPQPGVQRVIPGKLFEYLAACRPILALAPPGRAASIVEASAAGEAADPLAPAQAAAVIARWLQRRPAALPGPPVCFDRRYTAGMMALVLDEAAALGPGPHRAV